MKKITWQGQIFDSIIAFDCRVVKLNNYFIVIPISVKEYRDKNPTQAKVIIKEKAKVTEFIIYDDYGKPYYMVIPNTMKEEIEFAKQSAIKENLIKGEI
jgi:hypothetical protein